MASSQKPDLRSARYASLDIWRGAACLLIVILHATLYSHYANADQCRPGSAVAGSILRQIVGRMGVGVYAFFVVSGYCIAATADAVRSKTHPTFEYFRRRFRRIFPPYWAAVLLAITLALLNGAIGRPSFLADPRLPQAGAIPHPSVLTPAQWLGNATLTETWLWRLAGGDEVKILGPSWTLCYEVQFYVIFGLLLAIVPRRMFTGAAIVSAISILTMAFSLARPDHPLSGFFFDGSWLMFAAGVAVYYHAVYATPRARRWLVIAGILGAIALAVVRYVALRAHGDAFARQQIYELLFATIFALALVAFRRWDLSMYQSRWLRPLRICGVMCYSLYLVHWPVSRLLSALLYRAGVQSDWNVLLITIPALTAISLACGWTFYLLVERRFLSSTPNRSRRIAPAPEILRAQPVPLA